MTMPMSQEEKYLRKQIRTSKKDGLFMASRLIRYADFLMRECRYLEAIPHIQEHLRAIETLYGTDEKYASVVDKKYAHFERGKFFTPRERDELVMARMMLQRAEEESMRRRSE